MKNCYPETHTYQMKSQPRAVLLGFENAVLLRYLVGSSSDTMTSDSDSALILYRLNYLIKAGKD